MASILPKRTNDDLCPKCYNPEIILTGIIILYTILTDQLDTEEIPSDSA